MLGPSRLEIDAGNTRVKWRCVDVISGEVLARGSLLHDSLATATATATATSAPDFKHFMIEAVYVSSVSGEAVKGLLEVWLQSVFNIEGIPVRYVVSSSPMCGVTFSYKNVERLGVDRCLAMIAGYQQGSGGVLVVDGGSAITADYVSAEGVHLGGYILPGLGMLKASLIGGTAKVIVEHDVNETGVPGRSTEECVEHGRLFMMRSFLGGLVSQGVQLGCEALIVTGGDGKYLAEVMGRADAYIEDLVFDGLSLLASRERRI